MICEPGCVTRRYMSCVRRFTSSEPMVSAELRVMLPLCCRLLMCWPAMPTFTTPMLIPDCSSAWRMARLIASTVLSILRTMPRETPSDTALPMPRISSFPNSFLRPTKAQIFVVPMSSPTTILSCCIKCGAGERLGKRIFLAKTEKIICLNFSEILLANDLILVFHVHAVVSVPTQNGRNLPVKYHKLSKFLRNIFGKPEFYTLVADLLSERKTASRLNKNLCHLGTPEGMLVDVAQKLEVAPPGTIPEKCIWQGQPAWARNSGYAGCKQGRQGQRMAFGVDVVIEPGVGVYEAGNGAVLAHIGVQVASQVTVHLCLAHERVGLEPVFQLAQAGAFGPGAHHGLGPAFGEQRRHAPLADEEVVELVGNAHRNLPYRPRGLPHSRKHPHAAQQQ